MAEKFIPKEKRSKKEQKAMNAAQRNLWNINPVTRIKESAKKYNRNKTKRETQNLKNEGDNLC